MKLHGIEHRQKVLLPRHVTFQGLKAKRRQAMFKRLIERILSRAPGWFAFVEHLMLGLYQSRHEGKKLIQRWNLQDKLP